MNAVMGMVHMGKSGVDVLHLNLHKTNRVQTFYPGL